ncbi:MAG TPA: hypothetical protein VGL42_06485 [Opitutaceae bacterium]|jgi:hypothetical protein
MLRPRIQALSFAAGLLGLASVASAAPAGTVYIAVGPGNNPVPGANDSGYPNLGGQNPFEAGDGGEFTLFTTLAGQNTYYIPTGYASQATVTITANGSSYSSNEPTGTGFESFCAEDAVQFNVGETYNWTYGLYLSGETPGQDADGNSITNLTEGAAYLYQLFATGQLAGYYSGNDQTRIDNAGFLQSALWALEGEIPSDGTGGDPTVPLFQTGTDNPYLDLAVSHFGTLEKAEQAVTVSNESTWDVQLMELKDSSGKAAQAQFIYTNHPPSVPDAPATLALLTLSLAGLVTCRRRFAPVR